MEETTQIIQETIGINWINYSIYSLNHKHKEAHLINTWREHKFDSGRNTGSPDHSGAKEYHILSGHAISQWKEDGMPGGFNGCRDNYRITPQIIVNDIKYIII